MSGEYRTSYADDALRVESGTQPEEIRDFVERRAMNPHKVNGVTVWNFNNHELNKEALEEQSDGFYQDKYVVPYQASGVWGYMVNLLPERLRKVEILTYQQDTGKYVAYPNYIYHSERSQDTALRAKLSGYIREEVGIDGRI